MGATPLYLVIILVQANAYSRASATLHLSGTYRRLIAHRPTEYWPVISICTQAHTYLLWEMTFKICLIDTKNQIMFCFKWKDKHYY